LADALQIRADVRPFLHIIHKWLRLSFLMAQDVVVLLIGPSFPEGEKGIR
jgi:hypothetical protein